MAEDPVGQTRESVLFGDGRFHPHEPGGEDRRSRGVTAHTDDDIGTKFAEDPKRGDKTPGDLREGSRGLHRPPPLYPFHADGPEGEPQPAQNLLFQAPFGADKEDPVRRVSPEELFRDGDTRKEMPARSTAGDDHPEAAAIR